MTTATDDLGHSVEVVRPARRVVSLVPSLTEAVAATRPDALVGATDWCTHPADLDVPRVRGTKNPDRAAIAALEPDLVLANREENRELDVQRLRDAGINVWVTVIETVDEAFASMERMFTEGLGWDSPAWLDEARAVWADPHRTRGGAWRSRSGAIRGWWSAAVRSPVTSSPGSASSTPSATAPTAIPRSTSPTSTPPTSTWSCCPTSRTSSRPTTVPRPSSHTPTRLVSGRSLTWYGPSMLTARAELESTLDHGPP